MLLSEGIDMTNEEVIEKYKEMFGDDIRYLMTFGTTPIEDRIKLAKYSIKSGKEIFFDYSNGTQY